MTMKKIFSIWLTIFVVAAFIVTIVFSYGIQSKLARKTALAMLENNLKDAEERIKYSNDNLKRVKELTESGALAKTRAFARIIKNSSVFIDGLNAIEKTINDMENSVSKLDAKSKAKAYRDAVVVLPEYAKIRQILIQMAKDFYTDELTVTDGKGIMICSLPEEYIGYDMTSNDQSNEFVNKLIKDENTNEFVQEPMLNGYNKIFQYVGVRRKEGEGFVQIGYSPQRLEEATKIADILEISKYFRIGKNGKLSIVKENGNDVEAVEAKKNLNGHDKIILNKDIDGIPSFCVYKKYLNLILIASLPVDEMFLSRNAVLRTMVIGFFVLFTVIFFLISMLLEKVVIKGIYSVNDSLNRITEGNLNETVKVHNTKEFDELSNGINATVGALKKAIEAESKRIDAELEIGRTIQKSVLPDDFPDNETYTIYASMDAAKEVGGDFYDFFQIDENHNAMLIADVSGKGITAALFMMNAKALVKELILSEKSLSVAIEKANKELCENNKARLFVTMFIAILDTETGEMVCVNAGHNPPLLFHDGVWEYQKIKHSMALGVSKKVKFTEVIIKMKHNDSFFMYTDGVTEAQNVNNELYGEKRLLEFISKQENNPKIILPNIKEDLKLFSGEAPQSDDITMIMGHYK